MMTEDIEWPDGGHGPPREGGDPSYWEGQFAVADPRVEPIEFVEVGADHVAVVEQRIADLEGRPLAGPTVVFHRYAFAGDLACRMVVFTERDDVVAVS